MLLSFNILPQSFFPNYLTLYEVFWENTPDFEKKVKIENMKLNIQIKGITFNWILHFEYYIIFILHSKHWLEIMRLITNYVILWINK